MGDDWQQAEVEAVVADYLAMLRQEILRQPYNKTEHNTGLQRLVDRSRGSIEFKHNNISAVLRDLGHPWISGYKPRSNYQALLFDVVAERIGRDQKLRIAVEADVASPVQVPAVKDLLKCLEPPPEPEQPVIDLPAAAELSHGHRVTPANYLERESANRILGRAGEEFVLEFERLRLIQSGREKLAQRIEHVSASGDDGAGFDIRSFEENGRDRLIEVKTTAYAKGTPFFVSRNEVSVSQQRKNEYFLYRLFKFREDPRLFTLRGDLNKVCRLRAESYSARVA